MNPNTPSKLEKILRAGHLAVTSECGPPRGSDAAHIVHKAELIKNHVDAINITDNQTSVCRLCSLAACIRLKLMGLEPVLQMVVRDRNRIALQSDILGAASFDIHNILCLSGDHQSFGDCAQGQKCPTSIPCSSSRRCAACAMRANFSAETPSGGRPACSSARRTTPLRTRSRYACRAWPRRSPPGWNSSRPSASTT